MTGAPTRKFSFLASFPRFASLPAATQPEVVLLGRSNVGKSSLINLLAGRRRLARTSGTPGKTTGFNLYAVDDACVLVDVPGLGFARASRATRRAWERELSLYLRNRKSAALVLILMDARHAPTASETDIMEFVKDAGLPAVVVLTKTDKLSGNGRARTRRSVAAAMDELGVSWPVVETSASTGTGRDDLFEWIDHHVGG